MAPNQSHFQIYGRTSYEMPLTFIMEISIEQPATEAMIIEQSLAAVGKDDWIEVIALPSTSLVHVTEAEMVATAIGEKGGEDQNG